MGLKTVNEKSVAGAKEEYVWDSCKYVFITSHQSNSVKYPRNKVHTPDDER